MRRLAVVVSATATAMLLAAAPAQSLEYVSALEVGGQNTQGGADAMCPENKHVTGGGVFSNVAYNTTTINDSHPIDGDDADLIPDDGWRGTFDNPTSASPNLTTLAICGKAEPEYRSKPFATHSSVTTRPCPSGTKPSGGGVSTDGTLAQESRIISSFPGDGTDSNSKPDGWVGYGEAAGLAQIPARVYAICVPKRKPLRYRVADIAVPPNSQASGEAECREEQEVIGIGAATLSAIMTINTMYGLDGQDSDFDPDDGAQARIDSFLNFDRTSRVYAICAA